MIVVAVVVVVVVVAAAVVFVVIIIVIIVFVVRNGIYKSLGVLRYFTKITFSDKSVRDISNVLPDCTFLPYCASYFHY